MKEVSPLKWKDIVTQVEKAGIEEQNRIKQQQRNYSKQYVEINEEEIKRHKEQRRSRERQKQKERQVIEQQLKKEQQEKQAKRLEKKARELQYRDSNQELIKQLRNHKLPAVALPQHPFIRLVDQEEHRKLQSRNKFKLQNSINELQTKIKSEQRQLIEKRQKEQREQFIKHVDSYYDKKMQDRNIFKRKYLKLNNLERSRIVHSNNFSPNVEDEYTSMNSNQIDEHRQEREKKDNVDVVLAKLNKNNEIPNSSPAFLGRNPISYDRRRQLQYLHKGLQRKQYGAHVMKTEPTSTLSESKLLKQSVTIKELPVLQKFYHQNMNKANIRPKLIQGTPQHQVIQKSEPMHEKPYKIKTNDYSSAKTRVNTEPSEPARRKFLTFDIILGRSKEVYI